MSPFSAVRKLISVTKDGGKYQTKSSSKRARNLWHLLQRPTKHSVCCEEAEKTSATTDNTVEHYEEPSDSGRCSTVTRSTCSDSTASINSGGLQPNVSSPASSVSDALNYSVELPMIIHKRGQSFPLSNNEKRKLERELHKRATSLVKSEFGGEVMGSEEDSKQFVKIWELDLLPKLEKVLDEKVQGTYSINVRRGDQDGHRTIEIMTAEEATDEVRTLLEECKDQYLDGDIGSRTTMRICVGSIEFLVNEAPSRSSTPSEDNWQSPINTRRYSNPVMGDSVGPRQANGGSATMGPLLQIAQNFYRVLNWHVFDDRDKNRRWNEPSPPALDAVHPSLDDSGGHSVTIGKTVAYSGLMHKTSRISRSIQHACSVALGRSVNPVQTVTDWVLVETTSGHQVNRVREVNMPAQEEHSSFSRNITRIADPKCGAKCLVYSTGRSSGHSYGQICEVLDVFKLQNGTKTRNWCVESTQVPDEDWNLGGMGVPGDSGAPVIDRETNSLLGQIWGRSKYKVTDPQHPPLTYFTAMSDIYDDIRDRTDWGMPSLPTDASLAAGSRPPSPATNLPIAALIANEDGRRPTLASISEDVDEQPTPQLEAVSQRRSAARARARLSGYGNLPGLEPVRRWAAIAHAATF
ncbi:hypothetical protein F4677DRAFT_451016 [Hypoxylon crocopeplum]|nr:hypothetical protein F4677DRAFT_451016 [Hypoxylon crocopeplum]